MTIRQKKKRDVPLCGCCDSEATHICEDIVRDEYFCDTHMKQECCRPLDEAR